MLSIRRSKARVIPVSPEGNASLGNLTGFVLRLFFAAPESDLRVGLTVRRAFAVASRCNWLSQFGLAPQHRLNPDLYVGKRERLVLNDQDGDLHGGQQPRTLAACNGNT